MLLKIHSTAVLTHRSLLFLFITCSFSHVYTCPLSTYLHKLSSKPTIAPVGESHIMNIPSHVHRCPFTIICLFSLTWQSSPTYHSLHSIKLSSFNRLQASHNFSSTKALVIGGCWGRVKHISGCQAGWCVGGVYLPRERELSVPTLHPPSLDPCL